MNWSSGWSLLGSDEPRVVATGNLPGVEVLELSARLPLGRDPFCASHSWSLHLLPGTLLWGFSFQPGVPSHLFGIDQDPDHWVLSSGWCAIGFEASAGSVQAIVNELRTWWLGWRSHSASCWARTDNLCTSPAWWRPGDSCWAKLSYPPRGVWGPLSHLCWAWEPDHQSHHRRAAQSSVSAIFGLLDWPFEGQRSSLDSDCTSPPCIPGRSARPPSSWRLVRRGRLLRRAVQEHPLHLLALCKQPWGFLDHQLSALHWPRWHSRRRPSLNIDIPGLA